MCARTQVLKRAVCWGEEHKSELPFAYMVNAVIWLIIRAIQGTEGDDHITGGEVRRWMKMSTADKQKNARSSRHGAVQPAAATSVSRTKKTPV